MLILGHDVPPSVRALSPRPEDASPRDLAGTLER
jgi:hypothetical protein